MYKKVKTYIEENQMIKPGDTVLAGVSGGADSMAMLSLLADYAKECPFRLRVIHVHHGIRGKEADRDSRLVENICRQWGIPCQIYSYNVPSLAKKWKMGHEEAGRTVRKEAFQKECSRLKLSSDQVRIALAHNKNDVAETMIHNLGRGTGLRGLSTMRPCTGNIIRPVLCMERKEILAYLEQKQISYIVDSSNLSDEYTRNRIRHHILPLMEQEVNERAAAHMAETARQIAQAEDYLCRMGREALLPYQKEDKEYLLADSFFEAEPVIVNYALWCAFETLAGKRKDFTSLHLQQVRELAGKQTGRQISLPYDLVAERTYGGVRIAKKEQKTIQSVEWELPLPGVLTCPFGTFETKIFSYEGQKIEEKKYTKWLDYDKIGYNLCIRTRRPGDFLIVNKEGNKKKINRCMIDDKIPKSQRETIPLVACGSEILWMIGGRMNEKYKITPETGRVLELQCQGGKCNE